MKESKFKIKQILFALCSMASFIALMVFFIREWSGGLPLICLSIHTCTLLLLYREALLDLEDAELEQEIYMLGASRRVNEESETVVTEPCAAVEEPLDSDVANACENEPQVSNDTVEPDEPEPETKPITEEELAPVDPLLSALLPQKQTIVEMDLIAAAKDAMASLTSFAESQKIKLHLSTTCDSILMKADPASIRILFRNIIDNSIKYMGRPGHMIITISLLGDDIFLILKDTGHGLSEDETTHVFELNFQGSNRVSGNGLGLTQTKMIVEAFGGTIYAKSSPGQGMAIYIQLPVSGTAKTES